MEFATDVLTGNELDSFIRDVQSYGRRESFNEIEAYLTNPSDRIFVLCSLAGTGKKTLMKQTILGMKEEERKKAAFIRVTRDNTLHDIYRDLKTLKGAGIRYVFIDEVTLIEDFIEGSAFLSDIFASSGMKIVLSGTDSLGFVLSEDEQLYDRTVTLHTTFIPYREFENVLGIRGIDEYIRYGGTMCVSGTSYNTVSPFRNRRTANEYVDSSIAENIQHSLTYYKDGGHFRSLYALYEKNELTSAVNRVVEDMNHLFTVDVLTRDFKSHDFSISRRNLLNAQKDTSDILESIDIAAITARLKDMLSIRNREEQKVKITEAVASEIKEYLELLDLIFSVDVVSISDHRTREKRILISQPGLRYAQAEALIESLLEDEFFETVSSEDKLFISDRILNEIRGRMLEDIVLLETSLAFPEREVFVLKFRTGEFDMVVHDRKENFCDIYEIKHSTAVVPEQYRHLIDEDKCRKTEHFYGNIKSRNVLYRGESTTVDNINYINVEEYLKALPLIKPVTYL